MEPFSGPPNDHVKEITLIPQVTIGEMLLNRLGINRLNLIAFLWQHFLCNAMQLLETSDF